MPTSAFSCTLGWSRTSCDTSLSGSLKSPKRIAFEMQDAEHAGVASGSTPGTSPRASPLSTRSTQKVHFCATPTRSGWAVASSCRVCVWP
ncbi:MAG: hypothetical protein M5U30_13330 [Burkholderiaceae bacterium]|nr:hypothetical protein [Burkholderiaceae bacterium]